MKRLLVVAIALMTFGFYGNAQEKKADKGFQFTPVKELKVTSVKNQASSGTCWCYSGLSFIESELMRKGKPEMDLAEMFVVYYTYKTKMERYVRYHGTAQFSQGGAFADIPFVIKNYGIVPQEVYAGLNYGEKVNKHSELESVLKGYANAIASRRGKLSTAWMNGYCGVLDAYFGKLPETFEYKGKEYTPKSFAESLDLDMDDYVSITSYTHHPYWKPFVLEIEDNWLHEKSYNVPLDEFNEIAEHAIMKGYSIGWGSDVSESYFKRTGVAMVPDATAKEAPGSDQKRWLGLSDQQRASEVSALSHPVPEKEITAEMRQVAFDNFQTTDDHGMHIYGIAKDQNGTKYYMVKNSWGEAGKYKGHWYVSQNYFKYKTMNYMIHKDALPKKIAKKLGLR